MKFNGALKFLLAFQFLVVHVAHAISPTQAKRLIESKFANNPELKDMHLESYITKGKNGERLQGLRVVAPNSKRLHGQSVYLPDGKKELMADYHNFMNKFGNLKAVKRGLKGGDIVMADVITKLPPETFSFFLALGAIEYVKMVFNPSMNAMGVYQQVESQKHPITHISFGAFMYANGAVAPLLNLLNPKNPLFRYRTYMSMSAGMVASDTTHETSAIMDGKLERCLMDLEAQMANPEAMLANCDKAYESWLGYGLSYTLGMFPAISGLILDFFVASNFERHAVENPLKAFIAKKPAQRASLEFLLYMTPFSGQLCAGLKLARWSLRFVANTLPFTASSAVLSHPFVEGINSYTASASMKYWQGDLMSDLVDASASGWNDPELAAKATESIFNTSKALKGWRALNFQNLQNSYSAWLSKLSEISATYNLAEFVYAQVVKMTEPSQRRLSYEFLMRRPAPLFGIVQYFAENEAKTSSIYDDPLSAMYRQLQTIINQTSQFNLVLESFVKNKYYLNENLSRSPHTNAIIDFVGQSRVLSLSEQQNQNVLSKSEIEFLEYFRLKNLELNKLATQAMPLTEVADLENFMRVCEQIGKIFDELNDRSGIANHYPGLAELTSSHPSAQKKVGLNLQTKHEINLNRLRAEFYRYYRGIFGNPVPLFQPGALFFALLEGQSVVSINSQQLEQKDSVAGMQTFKPAQKIFLDMFFGPDYREEKEVFKLDTVRIPFTEVDVKMPLIDIGVNVAKMYPPRLAPNRPRITLLHEEARKTDRGNGQATLLNTPVLVEGKRYENFYTYAIDNWHHSANIKTPKELEKIFGQISEGLARAFASFNPFYADFVGKVFAQIRSTKRSWTNESPMYEGNIAQISLEKKFYLLVLGEIIRSFDIHPLNYSNPVEFTRLDAKLNTEKQFDPIRGWKDPEARKIPLLASLDLNTNLVLYDHFNQRADAVKTQRTEIKEGVPQFAPQLGPVDPSAAEKANFQRGYRVDPISGKKVKLQDDISGALRHVKRIGEKDDKNPIYKYMSERTYEKKGPWVDTYAGRNLKIQDEINGFFKKMTDIFEQIKIVDGEIKSAYTKEQIIKIRDEFQSKITLWKDLVVNPVLLTPIQLKDQKLKAYQLSLTALKSLIGELATYSLIMDLPKFKGDGNDQCAKATGFKSSVGRQQHTYDKDCKPTSGPLLEQ